MIGESLDAEVLAMSQDEGGWAQFTVQSDDGIGLQWKLEDAVGAFTCPGYSVDSCTVTAYYRPTLHPDRDLITLTLNYWRLLVKGESETFTQDYAERANFAEAASERTGGDTEVLKSTIVTRGWLEVYCKAHIPDAHRLHRWLVLLQGVKLHEYFISHVALATPLEVELHCSCQ